MEDKIYFKLSAQANLSEEFHHFQRKEPTSKQWTHEQYLPDANTPHIRSMG
jgi:hypothetical protein